MTGFVQKTSNCTAKPYDDSSGVGGNYLDYRMMSYRVCCLIAEYYVDVFSVGVVCAVFFYNWSEWNENKTCRSKFIHHHIFEHSNRIYVLNVNLRKATMLVMKIRDYLDFSYVIILYK